MTNTARTESGQDWSQVTDSLQAYDNPTPDLLKHLKALYKRVRMPNTRRSLEALDHRVSQLNLRVQSLQDEQLQNSKAVIRMREAKFMETPGYTTRRELRTYVEE